MIRQSALVLLLAVSLAHADSFPQADRDLNLVYSQVRVKNAADPALLARLKTSQLAWLKWRDAEVLAMYPDPSDGSAIPGCIADMKARLTRERIRQLQKWVTGIAEGDVCAGSLPLKH
jgi:uncharacterized protein YecT (DUF1311 family)